MQTKESTLTMTESPKYMEVAERLRGLLSGGERLPGERELAGMCQVSRVTVRKALELLRTENLVSRRGRCNFATGTLSDDLVLWVHFSPGTMSGFESAVLSHYGALCSGRGLRLEFCNLSGDIKSFEAQCGKSRAGVMVLCGEVPASAVLMAERARKRVLLFGNLSSRGLEQNCDRLTLESWQWAYRATRYLLANGARRIGLVNCASRRIAAAEVREGYRAALEEDSIRYRPDLVVDCVADSAAEGMRRTLELVELERPGALVCTGHAIGIGSGAALMELFPDGETALVVMSAEPGHEASLYPASWLVADALDAAGKLLTLTRRRLEHPSAPPSRAVPRFDFR